MLTAPARLNPLDPTVASSFPLKSSMKKKKKRSPILARKKVSAPIIFELGGESRTDPAETSTDKIDFTLDGTDASSIAPPLRSSSNLGQTQATSFIDVDELDTLPKRQVFCNFFPSILK